MLTVVISNIYSTDYSFNPEQTQRSNLLTCAVTETAPLIALFDNEDDSSGENFYLNHITRNHETGGVSCKYCPFCPS